MAESFSIDQFQPHTPNCKDFAGSVVFMCGTGAHGVVVGEALLWGVANDCLLVGLVLSLIL